MFQPDDMHERVDRLEVREFQPAPPHAARERTVAHRLPQRPWQAVRHGELVLFHLRHDKGPTDAGLHRMEVPQLAAAHLVHPHPLPRGAHEHHLLGDVAQRADPLSRPLEPLRRTLWQVLDWRVGLGPLARVLVEVRGPVAGGLVLDGNHRCVYCKARVTERKRPTSRSLPTDTPGTAIRPSLPMFSLITSAPRPYHRALGSRSEAWTHSGRLATASAAWEPIPDSGMVPAHSSARCSTATL